MDPIVDTRLRVKLNDPAHKDHKLTVNVYLSDLGALDARVWCSTCGRTLRAFGRTCRNGAEVEVGLG